ncbi:MAG: DNA-3-methyladenine glycosylase, partial [Gemmataceae bacterium]
VVEGQTYARTVVVGKLRGWLRVEPIPNRHSLAVEVPVGLASALPQILARLRGHFDLDARPDVIASHLCNDPRLAESVRMNPGLRVAGAFDGFELAVRAILGQQISVRAATTLAGRFVEAFGESATTSIPGLARFSPTPARIAEVKLEELTGIGLVTARAKCVQSLAKAVCDSTISLDPGQGAESFIGSLTELPGFGPWTAQYIAMRVLRWPDAFPHQDLGLRTALGGCSAKDALRLAEAWRPWRAYAAMHLWNGLAKATRTH